MFRVVLYGIWTKKYSYNAVSDTDIGLTNLSDQSPLTLRSIRICGFGINQSTCASTRALPSKVDDAICPSELRVLKP